MSVKVGLYDFFAFTIPGVFYLFTIGYVCLNIGTLTIDVQVIKDYSSLILLFGTLIAYVLGMLLDRVAKQWHRFFTPRDTAKAVLEKFVTNHPDIKIKIQPNDGAIIRAYIRKTDTETLSAIEKNGASRTMLRNISLNFMVLAMIFLVQSIFINHWGLKLGVCIVSIILSVLAGKQGVRYDEWFHALTYESAVALNLKPSDFAEISEKTKNEGETTIANPKSGSQK